jgi:D-sedoheptulose 7-phosphate isomerase
MEIRVFTNGCFDIIHAGHIDLLERAKKLGTRLIVGINSDESVRRIKGSSRPFVSQNDRAEVLRSLRAVDEVVIFDEATPQRLIEELLPDVLVKGGDWSLDQIVGADIVKANGGKVVSIPLKPGYSTTGIAEKMNPQTKTESDLDISNQTVTAVHLREHLKTINELLEGNSAEIESCGDLLSEAIDRGNKVLLCGNGGSAGDAQHIAAELIGRFEAERRSLPAIALTTDTSALTAIGNDYGFEQIFSRQVSGLAVEGDVLIGISTSGNSPNILAAVMEARRLGCITIGLTGVKGKKLASLCDRAVLVPSERTARIQEAHITIGHIWCEMVDRKISR